MNCTIKSIISKGYCIDMRECEHQSRILFHMWDEMFQHCKECVQNGLWEATEHKMHHYLRRSTIHFRINLHLRQLWYNRIIHCTLSTGTVHVHHPLLCLPLPNVQKHAAQQRHMKLCDWGQQWHHTVFLHESRFSLFENDGCILIHHR